VRRLFLLLTALAVPSVFAAAPRSMGYGVC